MMDCATSDSRPLPLLDSVVVVGAPWLVATPLDLLPAPHVADAVPAPGVPPDLLPAPSDTAVFCLSAVEGVAA